MKIKAYKHNAARTGINQAADQALVFKSMNKLLKNHIEKCE